MIPADSAWQATGAISVAMDNRSADGRQTQVGINPPTGIDPMQALMDSHVRFRDDLRAHLASGQLRSEVTGMVRAALDRVEDAIRRGCEEYGVTATP